MHAYDSIRMGDGLQLGKDIHGAVETSLLEVKVRLRHLYCSSIRLM